MRSATSTTPQLTVKMQVTANESTAILLHSTRKPPSCEGGFPTGLAPAGLEPALPASKAGVLNSRTFARRRPFQTTVPLAAGLEPATALPHVQSVCSTAATRRNVTSPRPAPRSKAICVR